jgi:hypothetical protein
METTDTKKINWHKVARTGILLSKISILFFILCFAITLTWGNTNFPYNLFLVGIEVAIFIMSGLMMLRMSTFQPKNKYDASHLLTKSEQLSLLLINITYDIDRYEEGSSYYFNGVRVYKYSTMILSGISTILLGLSFKDIHFKYDNIYPELSKNIAFIIGAIITIYTGLMTYWNIEKYWLQNKSVVNKLRALRDEIENEDTAQKLTEDEIQKKFDKYQLIKDEFYKYWEGALSGRNSQSNQ